MDKQQKIYKHLEAISASADPWIKTDTYQKKATDNLLALITSIPHVSILEVGCGRGVFTKLLTEISDDVTGIDVSASAIADAKKRVPNVKFVVSSLEDFNPSKKYDVIVCSEVLYYIKERKKALDALARLGKYLVTSNFVICLPEFCLGSIFYEVSLKRRFKQVTSILEHDFREKVFVLKAVWKL